jgi:hypothetical protein
MLCFGRESRAFALRIREELVSLLFPPASGRAVTFSPLSPPQAGEGDPFPPACGGNKRGVTVFPRENVTALPSWELGEDESSGSIPRPFQGTKPSLQGGHRALLSV